MPDAVTQELLQAALDHLTKPLGSLGAIERIAAKLGVLQQTQTPDVTRKRHLVFAADHAITEEGVSVYPASVTAQMVLNFLRGSAAVNVFARLAGVEVTVVDVGVDHAFDDAPGLVRRKVRRGSRNFLRGPALTANEVRRAMAVGRELTVRASGEGVRLLSLGEMGIGNTTPAAAIAAVLTGRPPAEFACFGTGIDERRRRHKAEVIEAGLARHRPDPADPVDVLCAVGGLEIAAITGACLAAEECGLAVVLDGYICLAGGALACVRRPAVARCLFGSHRGVEAAHRALLELMGLEDYLDLDMRLGEGTGAVLATGLLEAACRILREMATFDTAHVDRNHA